MLMRFTWSKFKNMIFSQTYAIEACLGFTLVNKGRSSQKFRGGLGKICKTLVGEGGTKIWNHQRFCGRKGGKPGWRGGTDPFAPPWIRPWVKTFWGWLESFCMRFFILFLVSQTHSAPEPPARSASHNTRNSMHKGTESPEEAAPTRVSYHKETREKNCC